MKFNKMKIISMIVVFAMLFNVISPIMTFASEEFTVSVDAVGNSIKSVLGVAGGILLLPVKYQILAIALAVQGIISMAASIGGSELALVGIDQIIFHNVDSSLLPTDAVKVDSVSIDFFGIDGGTGSAVTQSLAENVAKWYGAIRTLAVIALLIVLVYIAVRMLLSSTAGSKSKYKEMFIDWLVSFCLLFAMHYIMIAAVSINNSLMNLLYKVNVAFNTTSSFGVTTTSPILAVLTNSQYPTIKGFLYAIIYTVFVIYALIFLVIYLKRMFMLAFLTVIAPLITITYSIDKVKDSKSQAFDLWLKEYIYNVLVQPFDALLYIVIVSFAMNLMETNPIIALVAIGSMLPLRQWVAKFMGLDRASSAGNAMGTMGALWGMSQLFKGKGKSGSTSSSKTTKSTSNLNSGNTTTAQLPQAGNASNLIANANLVNGWPSSYTFKDKVNATVDTIKTDGKKLYSSTVKNDGILRGTVGSVARVAGATWNASQKLTAPLLASTAVIASGGESKVAIPAMLAATQFNTNHGSMHQYRKDKSKEIKESLDSKIDFVTNGEMNYSIDDLKTKLREAVTEVQNTAGLDVEHQARLNFVATMASKGNNKPKDLNKTEEKLYDTVSNIRQYYKDNGWDDETNNLITAEVFNTSLNGQTGSNLKPIKPKK